MSLTVCGRTYVNDVNGIGQMSRDESITRARREQTLS